jgi:hypothetical protein
VETDVLPLVVVDMDRDFFHQPELLAVGGLEALEIGREYVIGVTSRKALLEFAVMIRNHLPANFAGLVFASANLDGNSVDWMVVRAPHRPDDHGIALPFGSQQSTLGSEGWKE